MRTLRNLINLALLLTLMASPAGATDHRRVETDYKSLLKHMANIEIPVILPTQFPEGNAGLYAGKIDLAKDDYMIGVWETPACHDHTFCRYAHMLGGRPSAEKLKGKPVYLEQFGITGYFELGPCNFGCADSTLAFEIRRWRYVLGIKGAGERYLLKAARSLRYVKTDSFRSF